MRLRFGAPLQLNQAGLRQLSDRGFPAHAGMDPTHHQTTPQQEGLPRTRGDGPTTTGALTATVEASPHTRGWTPPTTKPHPNRRGFPAHAGMDPAPGPSRRRPAWLPRTRGDGPGTGAVPQTTSASRSFPAHAGMDPRWTSTRASGSRLPRTRGDGPVDVSQVPLNPTTSPHTRGWTAEALQQRQERIGFPAHAGMDPRPREPVRTVRRLPRTRGDGPLPVTVRALA